MPISILKKHYQKLKSREPYTQDAIVLSNSSETNEAHQWHGIADLVIVGFGGAGAAAALEAHEQGLDTLVLDRAFGGGATNISGGIFYAGGGTAIQKEAGIEDTPENMFKYLEQEVQGAVSDTTLKKFCDTSVENFDWLRKHGVPFDASLCPFKTSYPPNHQFFYYSGNESFPPYSDKAVPAPRGHRGHRKGISGAAIYQPLLNSVKRLSIRVKNQTKVTGLISDEHGTVIGVQAISLSESKTWRKVHGLLCYLQNLGRYSALYFPIYFPIFAAITELIEKNFGQKINIKANKGLVLATGGFFANQKMVQDYADSNFLGGSPLGTMSDDGSGIKLAQSLGADTAYMDRISAWRFINPPQALARGVLVGPSGKRICNEMLYGAQTGDLMMKHHQGKAWLIIDRKIFKETLKDLNLKKAMWFQCLMGIFYLYLESKSADTISELAKKIDIDPEHLASTLTDYNTLADSSELDPEGKPKSFFSTIEHGPYYAIDCGYHSSFVPCASLTLGGLKVDEESGMVKKEDGENIKGLYAIGRTAVGIPSKGYVSGLSIADCVFSGRRAAQHAATKN